MVMICKFYTYYSFFFIFESYFSYLFFYTLIRLQKICIILNLSGQGTTLVNKAYMEVAKLLHRTVRFFGRLVRVLHKYHCALWHGTVRFVNSTLRFLHVSCAARFYLWTVRFVLLKVRFVSFLAWYDLCLVRNGEVRFEGIVTLHEARFRICAW